KNVGPNGKVISVEPNPENLWYLRSNIRTNRLNNIVVVPKALADDVTRAFLHYEPKDTALGSILLKRGKKLAVETSTLNLIHEKLIGLDRVRLVKIDTEGLDLQVLRGGLHILGKVDNLIVEQNNREIRSFLIGHGFELETLKPSGYLFAQNIGIQA
ncbi:MAG: FkbM family methyltransferase, partial [Candidatus Rokuibacteriota bacterium]